jgi:hypothetical protein
MAPPARLRDVDELPGSLHRSSRVLAASDGLHVEDLKAGLGVAQVVDRQVGRQRSERFFEQHAM